MTLKRWDFSEEPFSSAAAITDEDLDKKQGNMITVVLIAVVLYSSGGNVIIWMKPKADYKAAEILVSGEKFFGETLAANRFKEFQAQILKERDDSL